MDYRTVSPEELDPDTLAGLAMSEDPAIVVQLLDNPELYKRACALADALLAARARRLISVEPDTSKQALALDKLSRAPKPEALQDNVNYGGSLVIELPPDPAGVPPVPSSAPAPAPAPAPARDTPPVSRADPMVPVPLPAGAGVLDAALDEFQEIVSPTGLLPADLVSFLGVYD